MAPVTQLQLLLLHCIVSFVISSTITQFSLTVDSPNGNGGGDGSNLDVTIYWSDNQYLCTFSPNNAGDGTVLPCNDPTPTPITPGTYIQFYVVFEYSGGSAIQFNNMVIVDGNGFTYTINDFCIPSLMQCTFENQVDFPTNGGACNHYDFKDSYSSLALGGSTKFNWLYVDLLNGLESYPNSNLEGSVRPPSYNTNTYLHLSVSYIN